MAKIYLRVLLQLISDKYLVELVPHYVSLHHQIHTFHGFPSYVARSSKLLPTTSDDDPIFSKGVLTRTRLR